MCLVNWSVQLGEEPSVAQKNYATTSWFFAVRCNHSTLYYYILIIYLHHVCKALCSLFIFQLQGLHLISSFIYCIYYIEKYKTLSINLLWLGEKFRVLYPIQMTFLTNALKFFGLLYSFCDIYLFLLNSTRWCSFYHRCGQKGTVYVTICTSLAAAYIIWFPR